MGWTSRPLGAGRCPGPELIPFPRVSAWPARHSSSTSGPWVMPLCGLGPFVVLFYSYYNGYRMSTRFRPPRRPADGMVVRVLAWYNKLFGFCYKLLALAVSCSHRNGR